MAGKSAERIIGPRLASYAVDLPDGGWPRLRLDYVTDGDLLLGPHHELLLTVNPIQLAQLARDLGRVAQEAQATLKERMAAAKTT